jgi:hypothetical protein
MPPPPAFDSTANVLNATMDTTIIITAKQLSEFAILVNSGNDFTGKTVKLGANIMLNDTANWKNWAKEPPKNKWTPIGNKDNAFNGVFDGNGFTVSGIYIIAGSSYQGLFGYIGSSGEVKKLGIAASVVEGKSCIGALAGGNLGTISHSYSTALVVGELGVGTLVGENHGTISNSYATGKAVAKEAMVGGLAGYSYGNIDNSYSAGDVVGKSVVGSLVGGSGDSCVISNSYSTSLMTGRNMVGELVGSGNCKIDSHSKYKGKAYEPFIEAEYIITTSEELADFRNAVNDGDDFRYKVIKLGANIMLNDTANWQNWASKPPKNKWIPIGSASNKFNGIFDGNGFVISGIYINDSNSYHGLFGYIDFSGIVKNLGVAASYVKGTYSVGGFVGESKGTISNSYFKGTVAGNSQYIGGFAGRNKGSINGSYSVASVTGESWVGVFAGGNDSIINKSHSTGKAKGIYYVGGLVGRNWHGIIINSYSTAAVSGETQIGGLAGYNGDSIVNSYSTGFVNGIRSVGGLVGFSCFGVISNSYSTGAVKGSSRTGGLIGTLDLSLITNSYSTGTVSGGKTEVNGFIGYNDKRAGISGNIELNGTASRSYYNKQTSGQSDKCKLAGKTTVEMKQKATFDGWDFDNIWGINPAINGGYPYLLGSDYLEKYDSLKIYSYNTCVYEPRIIYTAKEFTDFARAVNNGNNFQYMTIKLGANIMLNDTTGWKNWASKPPKNKWTPIGTHRNSFDGTFDGNGFTISGVYVNSSKEEQGLFGVIGGIGTVKNLGVIASYIKGTDKIGGIAGINFGIISYSYFIGAVEGVEMVGGIAGESRHTTDGVYRSFISYSYSVGTVTGANDVGGIAGYTYESEISHSYSTSTVTGIKGRAGGLVGYLSNSSTINNSYSVSKVIGIKGSTGDLTGYGNQIERSYYDMEINEQSHKDRYIEIDGKYYMETLLYNGGKTTAEMKQKATFNGWDFDKTWGIGNTINNGYPYLLENKHRDLP